NPVCLAVQAGSSHTARTVRDKKWAGMDCFFSWQLGGLTKGMNELWIGTATADIALQGFFDFLLGKIGIFIHQSCRRDNHPWGAISTLKCIGVQKCLLHFMEFPVLLQTLHGGDLLILNTGNGGDAGGYGRSVH